jgi:hypothetical protein
MIHVQFDEHGNEVNADRRRAAKRHQLRLLRGWTVIKSDTEDLARAVGSTSWELMDADGYTYIRRTS